MDKNKLKGKVFEALEDGKEVRYEGGWGTVLIAGEEEIANASTLRIGDEGYDLLEKLGEDEEADFAEELEGEVKERYVNYIGEIAEEFGFGYAEGGEMTYSFDEMLYLELRAEKDRRIDVEPFLREWSHRRATGASRGWSLRYPSRRKVKREIIKAIAEETPVEEYS